MPSCVWKLSFKKKKIIFNQRIIALQYCVGFYQTLTWISHRFTQVPSDLNILTPPSHPTPLGCYRVLVPSSLTNTANSHWLSILCMVMYASLLLFPYISPSPSSPLHPQSPAMSISLSQYLCHYCCSADWKLSFLMLILWSIKSVPLISQI